MTDFSWKHFSAPVWRHLAEKLTITLNASFVYILVMMVLLASIKSYGDISDDELLSLDLESLLELKVESASKMLEMVQDSVSTVTLISNAQLKSSGATSIVEALRMVAGVDVRWNPMMQTITIRGFGQNPFTNRVLLLIDGIAYNSWNKGGFPQQPGFDFFNVNNVKQIEVIKGPSSSLYGENAFWGVINIVSLNGQEAPGLKLSATTGDRHTRDVSLRYGQSIDQGSWITSFRWRQSQYPTQIWLEQGDDTVQLAEIFLKGIWGKNQLSYYRLQDKLDGFEEPLPQITPTAVYEAAPKISQKIDILAFKNQHDLNENISLKSNLSYAQRSGGHCASCHSYPQGEFAGEMVDHGYQFFGEFSALVDINKAHKLLVGLEARKISAGEHKDELGVHPGHPREAVTGYSKQAIYLQDEWSPTDALTVTTGVRVDDKTSPELFGSRTSPRLAALYKLSDRMRFRAAWNKASHYPDFSTLYQNTWFINVGKTGIPGMDAFALANFAPNPDLAPETIQSFNLGFEYQVTDTGVFKVDGYRSKIDDFHVLAYSHPDITQPSILRWENHPDQAIVVGLETEYRWQDEANKWGGFINWSWKNLSQNSDLLDSTGKEIEFVYAPKHKINLGTFFRSNKSLATDWGGLFGSLELSWKDEMQVPSMWYEIPGAGPYQPIESHTFLNAKLGAKLPITTSNHIKPYTLSLVAKNLLNKRICETKVGIPCEIAGREFFLTLTYDTN